MEAGDTPIVYGVADRHGFSQVANFAEGGNREGHFFLPEAMIKWHIQCKSGFTEIAFIEKATLFDFASG
jgi:hypothetical protein